MQTKAVEVSSGGNVLSTINVSVFETVAEAINHFGEDGETSCVNMINAQHRANEANKERTRLTRGTSPLKALRELVKTNDEAKGKVEELLAALGIDGSLS